MNNGAGMLTYREPNPAGPESAVSLLLDGWLASSRPRGKGVNQQLLSLSRTLSRCQRRAAATAEYGLLRSCPS